MVNFRFLGPCLRDVPVEILFCAQLSKGTYLAGSSVNVTIDWYYPGLVKLLSVLLTFKRGNFISSNSFPFVTSLASVSTLDYP